MTTCILSGFAKTKRFVGTVYACNGSDLPQTQDFGTVQYQGPSETALTVPATTVTYTIIGKTPCGDDVRRITTKTYSSRSVANQWKSTGAGYTYISNLLTTVLYGSSLNNLAGNYAALALSFFPETFEIPTGTFYTNKFSLANDGNIYYATRQIPPAAPTTGAYILDSTILVNSSQLTLYYLDVHEVWTYDLV